MNRLFGDFFTLLFPLRCKLCNGTRLHAEPEICSPCLVALPREFNYMGSNNNTSNRIQGLFTFNKAYSFLRFHKKGKVQKLLHLIKYKQQRQLAQQLGRWFAIEVLWNVSNDFDLIVPVPLHPDRMKSRGFNQSMEIGKGIAQITGHPVKQLLRRKRFFRTQTQLNRWERFENTSDEFSLFGDELIEDKRVLLLDDIITTGATLSGSAKPLHEARISQLIVAAIALTADI